MQLDGELLIQPGSWRKLGPLASEVRRAVFIVEQGIDESEEWDEVDVGAVHWVALLDGEAIGCARLSPEGKIGRMAVLGHYRGRGVGTALLQACVEYAAQRKFAQVKLSAQQHALSFYEKQGFKAVGPPHEEVGIAHQWMSRELTQSPQGVPLTEFMASVKAVLDAMPAAWVTGTLSELRRQSSGHMYFTLVQTGDDGEVAAKVRATLWRTAAVAIEARFRQATGMGLANNQDVMVKVRAQSHAVHGFSLTVEDIHPEFTVGQLAARLEQIRRQLQAEGIFNRNRQVGLPQDFFRVAVLSPAEAAGLGDFRSRADALAAAGIVDFHYFTATFQGPQTVSTICAALSAIAAAHVQGQPFDAVAIIRGGGSEWDLASLNDIDIARAVCNMPMPVLCGIGHERDSTIIDEIACQRLPTPSMVIDFIESTVMSRLQRVIVNMRDIQIRARQQTTRAADLLLRNFQAVCDQARGRADMAESRLAHLRSLVEDASRTSVNAAGSELVQNWRDVSAHARAHVADAAQATVRLQMTVAEHARREVALAQQAVNQICHVAVPQAVRQRLETVDVKLTALADFVRSQDPADVLKRGYAIVMDDDGKPLTDAVHARKKAQLAVRFRDGSLRVTPTHDSAVEKNGKIFGQGE
jgi:exodeoxyribonuclease VII large subunit